MPWPDLRNPYARCPVDDVAELGALYDNNAQPRNRADLQALQAASAAARAAAGARLLEERHGPQPWDGFDLFLPPAVPRAGLIFVHGGRWMLNTSRETAFWAEGCTGDGAAFFGLNFRPLHPGGLAAQIDSVATGIAAAVARARELGLAADALCLAGHSSGAHLALAALLAPRRADAPPLAQAVGRVLLLGGMYDLEPLRRTVHQQALAFSEEDVALRSPLRAIAAGPPWPLPPTLVAVGAQESTEFIRQARALHWALQWQGRALWHELPGAAHFDAALAFDAAGSVLRRFALPR